MTPDDYYKAVHLGIQRARNIRHELYEHPTEYYPEMVRELNAAYISTIKGIIKNGDKYVDSVGVNEESREEFDKGVEVAMIVENYRAFLSTIRD